MRIMNINAEILIY